VLAQLLFRWRSHNEQSELSGFLAADGSCPTEYFPQLCQVALNGAELLPGFAARQIWIRQSRTTGGTQINEKSIFAPLAPQLWGENTFTRPPELGSQCGLGVSPSRATGVDLGGIPGFMQEVYCYVDEELLTMMGKAGCWLISWGIESGNEQILKHARKGAYPEKAHLSLTQARDVKRLGDCQVKSYKV
jgi:hypothetical protein